MLQHNTPTKTRKVAVIIFTKDNIWQLLVHKLYMFGMIFSTVASKVNTTVLLCCHAPFSELCVGQFPHPIPSQVRSFFFFFFFFFLRSPAISHHFWVRILSMWPFFFNPTVKAVTFRLRGRCVLGVFLLPAFTRLGHERQDLLSLCDEMHVCTD